MSNTFFKWSFRRLLFLQICSFLLTLTIIFSFDYILKGYRSSIFYHFELLALVSFFLSALIHLKVMKQRNLLNLLKTHNFSSFSLYSPIYIQAILTMFCMFLTSEFIPNKKASNAILIQAKGPDNSHILYTLDKDLYWLQSDNKIWHANSIKTDNEKVIGNDIDIFHSFQKVDHIKTYDLSKILRPQHFKKHQLNRGISSLFSLLNSQVLYGKDHCTIQTLFWYRITVPFLCLVIAVFLISQIESDKKRRNFTFEITSIVFFIFLYFFFRLNLSLGEHGLINPIYTFPIFLSLFIGVIIGKGRNRIQAIKKVFKKTSST